VIGWPNKNVRVTRGKVALHFSSQAANDISFDSQPLAHVEPKIP
jgi:hypothetical protein